MSTRLEEQLTAALHARAEEVQPEDLRPLVVPGRPRRPASTTVAVLAAAACTAVVAGSFGLGALRDGDTERPATDGPSALVGDVDGDGLDDRVSLNEEDELLLVRLGSGEVLSRRVGVDTTLVGLAEIGADGLAMVLEKGDGTGDSVVLRLVDGGFVRLRPAETPEGRPWIGNSGGEVFWVADRTLFTGTFPVERDGRGILDVTTSMWSLGEGGLVASDVGRWCWRPADQAHPTSSCSTGESADVDGDGREDAVLVQRPGPDGLSRVTVVLATGERVRTGWSAWEKPRLLTTADFEGDGRSEIVLRVDGPQRPPVVLDLYDGRLLPEPFPEQQVNGWSPVSPRNRWAVIDGQVVSWELSGDDRPGARVRYWRWESLEDRFSPVPLEARCLTAGVGPPVPCTSPPERGLDVGPRGDLPVLFPAVRERVGVGGWVRFAYQSDDDTFRLRGDLSPGQDRVQAGEVELVVTVDGVEHSAPVPAGPRPRVSPQTVASRGAPGFLVMQESRAATRMTVYSFWNGELRALRTPDGRPFGANVDVPVGANPYRTWITEDGRLFTAEELDTPSGRNRVFAWSDDLGTTLQGRDLGEVCIDWDAEPTDYGRCPG